MSINPSNKNDQPKKLSNILTNQEKETIVYSIGKQLKATYVFPDVAKEMADFIIENLKKGNYNSIDNPHEFANQLSKDLVSISHDKHIRVVYHIQQRATEKQTKTAKETDQHFIKLKRENFGFKELKLLNGNIGYLDLRSFCNVKYAGETAVAAMNFLSNSDAVIIDLRWNGGGSPTMIQLISSYLFSDPTHLNTFYWRPTDSHSQTWTIPHVQGTKFPETAVYILTSKRTFSAAEEFSYNLKNLKRATLIGETTGGGAHPGGPVFATDRFAINVPSGRAINPITKTNWEGTGVTPHIKVPSNQALEIAQIKALETLLENSETEEQKAFYKWNLSTIKILLEPLSIEKTILKSYIGSYGHRKIIIEGNTLFSQLGNDDKYELIPLTESEFIFKDNHSNKIKFLLENAQTIGLELHYQYGQSSHKLLKTKE